MQELHPCSLCGSPAVEQVRGELTKDDAGFVPFSHPASESNPSGIVTSNNPNTVNDRRVCCSNEDCDNFGNYGWNRGDWGDYLRFVWNRDNPGETA